MTFQAIPLSSLFAGLGLDPDAYLEVVALDGYVSEIPVGLVLNAEPAKPIAAAGGRRSGAPVARHPREGAERRAVRAGLWPYQAASIAEVLSPVVRWPQLAASSSLSEGDAGREGQDLFFAHYLVCHKLAGGGAADLGPTLSKRKGLPHCIALGVVSPNVTFLEHAGAASQFSALAHWAAVVEKPRRFANPRCSGSPSC